jgi:hypothetical protein
MRATAIMLGIVVAATGCDKTPPPVAEAPAAFDLSARPEVVFQVFGDRQQPRMVPVAAILDGALVPLDLDDADWRRFDSLYFAPGAAYPTVRAGRTTGTVTIARGMWSDSSPTYTLPGCRSVLPAAVVWLDDPGATAFVVEQFASSKGSAEFEGDAATLPRDSAGAIARRLALEAGRAAGIDAASLDALVARAVTLPARRGAKPTIVATWVDSTGGDAGGGRGQTANLVLVADDTGAGYRSTYTAAYRGNADGAEARRYLGAMDVTGDGTAEIILEAWRYAGGAAPVFLAWRDSAWTEVFRGRSDWCLQRDAR